MSTVNDAILSIYDSTLDLGVWTQALNASVRAIGAHSSTLMFNEYSDEFLSQWTSFGGHLNNINPELLQHYNENLIHLELDGWAEVQRYPKQTIILDTDVWNMPDSELLQRADYKFAFKEFGLLRRAVARLNSYPSWSDNIAFQFSKKQTTIPVESLGLINILLPHIAKSIELGRSFDLLRKRYNAVLAALDFMEVGIALATPDGTVVVSNNEADRIFSEDDGIKLSRKRTMKCRTQKLNEKMAYAIKNIALTSTGSDSKTEITFSIDRASKKRSYLAELSPLRDASDELEKSLHGALIMIIDPENSSAVNVERLALAYSLSEAEFSVTKLLVDGWTLSNIAEKRNVSIQTVKTQTTSIMRKTETTKRSELIRLALKLSPPVKALLSEQ